MRIVSFSHIRACFTEIGSIFSPITLKKYCHYKGTVPTFWEGKRKLFSFHSVIRLDEDDWLFFWRVLFREEKHQMCVRLTERPTGADNFGKCGTRLKRTLIEYLEMLLGTGRWITWESFIKRSFRRAANVEADGCRQLLHPEFFWQTIFGPNLYMRLITPCILTSLRLLFSVVH